MNEKIEWVEKLALENLRFRIQDADNLTKESKGTLTLLFAGVGGSLAFAIKLLDNDAEKWLLLPVFVFSAYLLVLCALLIFNCLKISSIPAPTNEPNNLYQIEFPLDALREAELRNIQLRINEAVTRNETVAIWLNRVRILSILARLFLARWSFGWNASLFAPTRLWLWDYWSISHLCNYINPNAK